MIEDLFLVIRIVALIIFFGWIYYLIKAYRNGRTKNN
jgi:uncharacterized membrane protein